MATAEELQQIYGQPSSSDTSAGMTPSVASQNASDADRDAMLRQVYGGTPATSSAPAQPSGILGRAWNSISDIASSAVQNLPSLTVNMPGTAAPQPVISEHIHAPLMAGIARGVKDVGDTGMRIGTSVLGGDTDALQKQQDASNADFQKEYGDSWAASGGRVLGQTLATAPVLGGAGSAVARAVPWLAAPAATTIGRGLQLAGQGAAAGAGASALTGQDIGTGTVAGAVMGPLAGGATSLLDAIRGLRGGVQPDIAELGQKALGYGIPINISQTSANPTMQIVAAQGGRLPFAGSVSSDLAARREVQSQIIGMLGQTGSQFTPGVMDNAATDIGNTIDNIAARTTINALPTTAGGPSLYNDLADIASRMPDYGLTAKDSRTGEIQAIFQNILDKAGQNNNTLPGAAYRSMVETDSPLDILAKSDNATSSLFGSQIKRALDAAFQRSAAPGDADALGQALGQYRILKTVQPLVEKSTTGDISMPNLMNSVVQQSRRFDPSTGGIAYTGGGQLGDLAKIGKQFLGPSPDSGTAARQAVWSAVQHPVATLAASPFLAANRGLQSYLRSPYVTQNLIQSSLPGAVLPSTSRFIPTVAAGSANLLGLGQQ